MVVGDAVGEGERVALSGADGEARAPPAALLVGHANGAVERRPRIAVGGIEEVEDLPGEIEPALLVEVPGVVLADHHLEHALPRGDVFVIGLGGGREVVRLIDALLVEVDVDVGEPAVEERDALLRLLLRQPCPVAVEVEPVVVGASARPRLAVLPGVGVGVRRAPHPLVVPDHVAVASVRVDTRIEDDNGVGEPGLRARVGVHVVAQPHDGRRRALDGAAGLPGHAQVVHADLVEVGQVLRRGDEGDHQRPPLVGLAVAFEAHVRRGGGHVLEVGDDAVVRRESVAEFIAEEVGGGAKGGLAEGGGGEQAGQDERGETARGHGGTGRVEKDGAPQRAAERYGPEPRIRNAESDAEAHARAGPTSGASPAEARPAGMLSSVAMSGASRRRTASKRATSLPNQPTVAAARRKRKIC